MKKVLGFSLASSLLVLCLAAAENAYGQNKIKDIYTNGTKMGVVDCTTGRFALTNNNAIGTDYISINTWYSVNEYIDAIRKSNETQGTLQRTENSLRNLLQNTCADS